MPSEQRLIAWCQAQLPFDCHTFERLAGDASLRTYYRGVGEQSTIICMDGHKEPTATAQFVKLARFLRMQQIPVPHVLAYHAAQGWVLLEDFGDTLLSTVLTETTVDDWYRQAMDTLDRWQQLPYETLDLPYFDQTHQLKELSYFIEWCVKGLLGITLSRQETTLLQSTFDTIIAAVMSQPTGCVHLDYHSRNLMVHPDTHTLGIIDFQDAHIGPVTYDLVSLIKDCYVAWPHAKQQDWIAYYHQRCLQQGHIAETVSVHEFAAWVTWTGLQRHLKVLGVFARLKLRDHKPGYIKDMPRVLDYIMNALQQLPQQAILQDFHTWMKARIVPSLLQYCEDMCPLNATSDKI